MVPQEVLETAINHPTVIHNQDHTEILGNLGNIFSIDKSLRGTAKCRMCKRIILKGDFRIGKNAPFKVGYIVQFFHVVCAFESSLKARLEANAITDISSIDGIDSVPPGVKSHIANLISDTNKKRKTTLVKPSALMKNSVLVQDSPKSKKTKLKSLGLPTMKVMFTNADQMTPSKMVELKKQIEKEKPLIVAVCEVKQKNPAECSVMDYDIPGYSIYPINLDNDTGRGIAIYSKDALEKSAIQIDSDSSFEEVCLIEVRLRGGDILLFGCVYRSPTSSEYSEQNNDKLNSLLMSVANKKYTHKCIVGNFNFGHINWTSWSTPRSENSAEAKFVEARCDS